ncbi:chemotaxis-specific protein-glutamate methyltransferase CheB [Chloroflexales bacterium ZM16-3]|nr:chemotaxis-specific protein-glutamate methyltransferase CheB [Chloroflexales bacterium ZM16-3]
MQTPIRVLVVDDSPSQLALLVSLLRAAGDFEIVGTAADGRSAVAATDRLRPGVVAMDIHLPVFDGYEATRQIMQRCPTPIVMFSGSAGDAGVRSMEALAAGALAVVQKPGGLNLPAAAAERAQFLQMLRLMSGVRVVTRHVRRDPPSAPTPIIHPVRAGKPEILAVAASTGGPAALKTFLEGLGYGFPLPILIVQHIARGFSPALQEWLSSVVPQPLHFARPDERLLPGHAYLAPDDHHLLLAAPGMAGIEPTTSADRYSPSADKLFASVARWYGSHAIGVIMTGMGDDGARGIGAMRAAGAMTLGQDEATCVVFGMPRAAAEAGALVRLLPLGGLAGAVLAAIPPTASLQRGAP